MDSVEIMFLVILLPVIYGLYKELGIIKLGNLYTKGKEKAENTRVKGVAVLLRNGKVLELRKDAKVLDDGSILVKDKLYKLPKVEPYILKTKWGGRELYILDANVNAVYEFQNIDADNIKTGKLNPVVLNPKTLYYYIASQSIRKLLGKITVSKGEAILYMFTGMVVIIILIFFLLPLLGHQIIIR